MKPSWDNAPEWANYMAMDDDGRWWWYEEKPMMSGDLWDNRYGKAEICSGFSGWKDSLEQRPSK